LSGTLRGDASHFVHEVDDEGFVGHSGVIFTKGAGFKVMIVSSTHYIYQLKVDKIRHFEVQIGGVINPVKPHADEWCCTLPVTAL
jgi:hypothetical protein